MRAKGSGGQGQVRGIPLDGQIYPVFAGLVVGQLSDRGDRYDDDNR